RPLAGFTKLTYTSGRIGATTIRSHRPQTGRVWQSPLRRSHAVDNAVQTKHWDPQVSHDDLIRHIQQVETGIEHLKEGQDRMLQKQDLTNGHVRELREWRAVQEALERERDAERKALQQERAETANRIRILMDAETARIAAANTTD